MRRLVPLALAALVVLTGCGTEGPTAVRRADATIVPAPTTSSTPAPSASATPDPPSQSPGQTPGQTGDGGPEPLEAVALDAGLYVDGDTTVRGPGREVPGAFLEELCDNTTWPGPADRRTDRMAMEATGPEWAVTRELVTYVDADSAAAVVAALRSQLAGCSSTGAQDVHPYDADAGYDAVTYGTTYRTGLGGTLVQVLRVGRAVLAVTEYGEFAPESQEQVVPDLTRDDRRLAAQMQCHWSEQGCGPVQAVTFTPEGAGPFRLGMDLAELRRVAPDVFVRLRRGSCAEIGWTSPQGVELHGAVQQDDGLAYLSAGSDSETVDGVGPGDDLDALHAAYPGLEHADNGLWYADQGETSYLFDLDPQTLAVDDLVVTADDQRCAS